MLTALKNIKTSGLNADKLAHVALVLALQVVCELCELESLLEYHIPLYFFSWFHWGLWHLLGIYNTAKAMSHAEHNVCILSFSLLLFLVLGMGVLSCVLVSPTNNSLCCAKLTFNLLFSSQCSVTPKLLSTVAEVKWLGNNIYIRKVLVDGINLPDTFLPGD